VDGNLADHRRIPASPAVHPGQHLPTEGPQPIIPGIGRHRLDRLTPEHLERFYTRLDAEGLAPATVLQIHRILSRALKVAVQRGDVSRNVATLVDAPSAQPGEVQPLTLAEAQKITALAAGRRNGTRWSVALNRSRIAVARW
jgi:integrase